MSSFRVTLYKKSGGSRYQGGETLVSHTAVWPDDFLVPNFRPLHSLQERNSHDNGKWNSEEAGKELPESFNNIIEAPGGLKKKVDRKFLPELHSVWCTRLV